MKCGVRQIFKITCVTCAKGILDSNYAAIDKISNFHEIVPFHIFTKIVIFKSIIGNFRPTASTLQILWPGHERNLLFHFCQL